MISLRNDRICKGGFTLKNIRTGTICAIISMVSVLVMMIWGFAANDFSHSWLAVMAGGILSCAFAMVRKDLDKAKKDKEGSE